MPKVIKTLETERAQFLINNLDLPDAAQYEGAKWENFQIAHLEDDSIFRCETKGRQIAWSFTIAAEAVADGLLTGYGTVFVSINLNEAKEKIRYAQNVIQALPPGMRPKLITNNRTEIEFDNGARLISLPSTAPRGKAQMNVYLDEFAHVPDDKIIYTAALPMMTKGSRRLRMGSSPMGASGMFWEVYAEELRRYPGYRRKMTPWWEVQAFCYDALAAYLKAPTMPTPQRVMMFGNERIKMIYQNMPVDDFKQEYECAFVDETSAWISWEIIRRNQQQDLRYYHIKSVDDTDKLIEDVKRGIKYGNVEASLVGGLDIGRTRNLTEFIGLGKSTSGQLPLRIMVSLGNVEYDNQEECFRRIITELPFTNVLIDRNGIGMHLAENLVQATRKAEGVNFTNATKELWAVEAKVWAERGDVPIPADRDLAYQIHSIKKKVTAAKNNVFDTDANEKHHADKFWAWALAIWAASSASPPPAGATSEIDIEVYKSERERNRLWRK